MTEELKAKIDDYVRDTCVYYRSTHEDMLPNQFEKYLRKACVYFATENGIQWHDLRKDPNDLPKDSRDYLICFRGGKHYGIGFSNGMRLICYGSYYDEIIAWCEIPQFKEIE